MLGFKLIYVGKGVDGSSASWSLQPWVAVDVHVAIPLLLIDLSDQVTRMSAERATTLMDRLWYPRPAATEGNNLHT